MSSLLLSIDLEDVRDWVEDGSRYREGVPTNTRCYLDHFRRWGVRATFFVVGRVARRYPDLIGEIVAEGHELACHGDMHLQLDKLTPKDFRKDLEENLLALRSAGADEIKGFRAPTFSLTEKTSWAHEILADLGFSYSSSILPAKNPLYGWPTFGQDACKVTERLWEVPITIHSLPGLHVPIAGGVYFRVLPFLLTRWAIGRRIKNSQPVGTYFHPYDIDINQEKFMHPDLGGKRYLNRLKFVGRHKVLRRLDTLRRSFPCGPYGEYVNSLQAVPF